MKILANPRNLFPHEGFFTKLYRRACSWLKYSFNRNHVELTKTAFKSRPWDSSYLLSIERAKIREMADYLEKANRFEGVERVVRHMRICLSLLEIIMGERDLFHFDGDILFKEDKDHDGGETMELIKSPDFKYNCDVYVNMKNMGRFVHNKKLWEFYAKFPHELYEVKARALYHKIRNEHEQEWWD